VSSANTPAPATGWKANLKTKGKAFGKVAYEKSWKWSDSIGGKVNDYAEKVSQGSKGIALIGADQLLIRQCICFRLEVSGFGPRPV
jgi:hypothetical protein